MTHPNPGVTPGLTGKATMIVGTNDTAPRVGSGRIPVLATPVMINLMEEAALATVEHLLEDGQQSLGTHLDVSHIAATPTGMRVVATAELTGIDGRTLTFRLQVRDEIDLIGEGSHTRVVVSAARFQERVDAKALS
jgi:fluoroacetyl-CoA thioesterase